MPTICPKCRTVRPADTQVPDWQCPACGVAYAKAGDSAPASTTMRHAGHASSGGTKMSGGIPWGKLLILLSVVYGAWVGFHSAHDKGAVGSGDGVSRLGHFSGNPSVEQLNQLAANTQASDVLMYSAAWCPNCTAAKGWMAQYGFKYQECDVDTGSNCASQLKSLDPQGGVPYLIVKGHHMKDGFDSDEFLAALTH